MTELTTLPVLPLRNTVVFPGATMPIAAGRPVTLKAIEAALRGESPLIFAVAQRDSDGDAVPDNLYTMGVVARIEQVQRGLGGVQLVLHCLRRAVAVRTAERDGFLEAAVREVAELPPERPEDPSFVALYDEVRAHATELGKRIGLPEDVVSEVVGSVEEPGRFADLVASYLEIESHKRQDLLQELSVEERLRRVFVHLQRQLQVLSARDDIKSKVEAEIGGRQREIFLREQLKAIQDELGEGDDSGDLERLKTKLDALDLPAAAREEVDRELGRLTRIGRDGMEAQVIRTFLETVAELPWNVSTTDSLDLEAAGAALNADHYGLDSVKDRVLEQLAVRVLQSRRPAGDNDAPAASPDKRAPILLFVGPPGVGKTSIAKGIANALSREYVRVALGGARDQADISGHRRTYVGAMPGRIIQGLKQAGSRNPVFLLDEIDKLGVSFQGDPASALLEVLDPAQNDSFTDHYLGVPFDLSEVLFIATANQTASIPGPLLDRMEVVEFSGYTEGEKLEIARRYLLPRQMERSSIDAGQLGVTDAALEAVISGYTREAGVRQLERELGKLTRKVARRIASGEAQRVEIDAPQLRELIGRPHVRPERAASGDMVGSATGMYYTPVGGDIMFVEASVTPGKGDLVLTGQLGDVMKESARAALTYARAHAAALRIPRERFDGEVHVHVPAGAIPKDGPSAGVTIATALVSALAERPVRPDIAMTGEITLSGRVLPIGGVKEKLLGAIRAGIEHVVLPVDNLADVEDLPEDALRRIEVYGVAHLGEVLALTLRGASFDRGRLLFGGDDPETVEPLRVGLN